MHFSLPQTQLYSARSRVGGGGEGRWGGQMWMTSSQRSCRLAFHQLACAHCQAGKPRGPVVVTDPQKSDVEILIKVLKCLRQQNI